MTASFRISVDNHVVLVCFFVLYLVWVCVQVDILSKLPKTEFNQKLAATKWSEILEGLNIAVDMIGDIPKLTPGDYGDLVQKVKRLGDHSHVQVRRLIGQALDMRTRSVTSRRVNPSRHQAGAGNHPLPDCVRFALFAGRLHVPPTAFASGGGTRSGISSVFQECSGCNAGEAQGQEVRGRSWNLSGQNLRQSLLFGPSECFDNMHQVGMLVFRDRLQPVLGRWTMFGMYL